MTLTDPVLIPAAREFPQVFTEVLSQAKNLLAHFLAGKSHLTLLRG